jgi:hypothetical protein
MADEGCPNVRHDAPIFGAEVNMGMMTAQEATNLIAPCFEGVKAKRSLHFCNGNLRGRPISQALHNAPWIDILERLDGIVDIGAFELKYFFQWIDRDAFKRMPKKHGARRRDRRRRQLLGRVCQENPRTFCRLGTRGRGGAPLGFAVLWFRSGDPTGRTLSGWCHMTTTLTLSFAPSDSTSKQHETMLPSNENKTLVTATTVV